MAYKLELGKIGSHEYGFAYDQEQDEKEPIMVEVHSFASQNPNVAIIIGGVHSYSEPQGVQLARNIITALDSKIAQKIEIPFTTIVVPSLFYNNVGDKKDKKNRFSDAHDRQVLNSGYFTIDKGRLIEQQMYTDTNRNFPQAGESFSYVLARAARLKAKIPGLKFPPQLFCIGLPTTYGRLVAENRILVQLIENYNPSRIVTIHQHYFKTAKKGNIKDRRGDEPGIFIDPRGGFDEGTDLSYTNEGKIDDELAKVMLTEALKKLPSTLLELVNSGKLSHPFGGNVATADGEKDDPSKATVHYAFSAKHGPGVSFGGWAPWPEQFNQSAPPAKTRRAAQLITVEIPQSPYTGGVLEIIKQILQDVIMSKFLQIPDSS